MEFQMRYQVAREDQQGPDVVRAQTDVRPARFVITSELNDYKLASSSPPIVAKKQPKIVTFDPPLNAQCTSIDGTRREGCLVLSVWDGGARLRLKEPTALAQFSEFFLLFTLSQKPVFRDCKRVWTHGYEIEVEYRQKQASYLMHMECDV